MQPGRPIHSNYNVVDYSTLPQAEDTSYLYQTANSDPNYGIITDTHNTSDAFGYPEISSINVEHQPTSHYYRNELSDSCMMQTQVIHPLSDNTYRPQYPSSLNSIQNSNFGINPAYDLNQYREERITSWDDQNNRASIEVLTPGPPSLAVPIVGPIEHFANSMTGRTLGSIDPFQRGYQDQNSNGGNRNWTEYLPVPQMTLPSGSSRDTFVEPQNVIDKGAPRTWPSSTSEFTFIEEPQPSKIKYMWPDGSAAPILGPIEQCNDYERGIPGFTGCIRGYSESISGSREITGQPSAIATVRPHGMIKTHSNSSLQLRKNLASRVAPRRVSIPTTQTQVIHQRSAKDEFLIQKRRAGMSYKDIRLEGGYTEAESTLRGRFRTLTKPKSARVRKPEWSDKDTNLLRQAVHKLAPRGSGSKIPWKKVAEYIVEHGGSYHFGNSTCRKRWDELQNE